MTTEPGTIPTTVHDVPGRTADVVDRFGEDLGDDLESCSTQLRQYGGHRAVVGVISTFRSTEDNLEVKQIIREPGGGRVLVIDTDASLRVAMLGDNMAAAAAEAGWAGIVVNGAVRDAVALAAMPLHLKALGTNPRRSRKEGGGRRDVPVHFGGATFTPGDLIVSDEDGIVVLPRRVLT